MSGTSEHCMLGSVVGCVHAFWDLFLPMSSISEHHWMLGSIVECGQGFKVLFLVMSGTSSTACWAVLWNVFRGFGSGSGHVRALYVGKCCGMWSGV